MGIQRQEQTHSRVPILVLMAFLSLFIYGCDLGSEGPLSAAQINEEANASIAEVEIIEEAERLEEGVADDKAKVSE